MDYSTVFKSLAKEAGVSIPSNAFSKPVLPTRQNSTPISKVSKCGKCGEPRKTIGWCKPCDTSKLNWGKVALKLLDNSENLTKDFLDELRAYHRCSLGSGIVDCYGVSKDPKTGSYVMVMRYAEQGSLRHYLTNYFADLNWDEKIVLFDRIGKALKGIHDSGLVHRYVAAMLRCLDCDPAKRPTIDELLNVSYKWRYLADGKAPFQGPKTKKVKTGHVKSVLTHSNAVHPQAFYTSRLLHFPNLPEPQNSDHYTLFDSTTGEIHMIVRKQNSKKDSETPSFTSEPEEFSSPIPSDKGKERIQEESRPRITRRQSVNRSMTMSTGRIDREMIEKIRNDRKKLSHYRWNSMINDLPRQVELTTIHGNFETNVTL
ncbi:28768_t:CDS:2 [Dentiscutata erythropus]|uniref:28768_t:CDS:1 n=1 Tax=Dentiscutata erythropus TaxID=1348616 RepID=A0A9N9E3H0_9GLOM|nr:28768_t:CDS:2 [Dentiscutata erythropus]